MSAYAFGHLTVEENLLTGAFTRRDGGAAIRADLEKVYAYEPVPAELTTEEARHVLGAQAQLWTEYMPDTRHVEYMTFPRLCALAEATWTPRAAKDYADFTRRLQTHLKRLSILGVNYRPLDK